MKGFYIEGYAIRFDYQDRYGRLWLPSIAGCKGVTDYFDQLRPVLFMHGDDLVVREWPLGLVTHHRVDSKGVWIKAFLCETEGAPPGVTLALHGVKTGQFRAFSVRTAKGKQDFRTVGPFDEMVEISIVDVPGQPLATFDLTENIERGRWIANRVNELVNAERAKRAEREKALQHQAQDIASRVNATLEFGDKLSQLYAEYKAGRLFGGPYAEC